MRGLLTLLLLASSQGFRISQPDTNLKLKILELQNFARTNEGVRDKRQSKPLEAETEDAESQTAELFGHKITEASEERPVNQDSAEDKLLQRHSRVVKKRRKRRFPRRSYGSGGGGYEAPRNSYAAPQTSYEAPEVSTHRPSYPQKSSHKKKKKPFTSFRSISSPKATSAPSSYTTPSSYSAPSPPKTSYSSPSAKPNYSSPPKSSYSSPPKSAYSSPPKKSYSSPPKPSYSSPPKPSYSSPPKKSYSSPPKPSYSSPPKPAYSSPKSGYSSPQPSYSPDDSSPSEYSYHYSVPETESQAWEERSGYTTQGSYSVLLPDGRTMTVTYSVPDKETGFLAEVSFDGEPRYPEDPPAYKHSGYTTHKREAKIHDGRQSKHFKHFKSMKDDTNEDILTKELGLMSEKALKFLPIKTEFSDFVDRKTSFDNVEQRNHETEPPHTKYPHFESFNTIHKIPEETKVKFPSFESFTADPISVLGEFPSLNPRQEHKKDQRQTSKRPKTKKLLKDSQRIFLETPATPLIGPLPLDHEGVSLPLALPVPLLQKSYQTTFQYKPLIGPENRQRPEEPYTKTNIQPFIYFQTPNAEDSVKTIDNVG